MTPFEFAGARVEFADAAAVLGQVRPQFQPVLHPAGPLPRGPVVAVLAARGGASTPIQLRAKITYTARSFAGPLHPAIVGVAYVAPIMDALSSLLDGPREALDEPDGARTDEATGLSATLVSGRAGLDGLATDVLDASVPAGDEAQLLAQAGGFLRIALGHAQKHSRTGDLAGRSYVLGTPPAGPVPAPGAGSPVDAAAEAGVRLDHLGGLADVVHQLRDVADSFRHPEVMARWGARRPQGILMWGPPGTGKTTLARALANEIDGDLHEIRTPDILSKWVGSSERNIKKIFTEARAYRRPSVLLFDEFDSIISYNGAPQGAADQVANSVAGLFKQEMNGLIDANPNVIVVATTNFPHRVDESLIRSGRFDIKLAVPLPDAAGRADILTKFLRQRATAHDRGDFRMFDGDVDTDALAAATPGLSGADLQELFRRVQMAKAMQEARTGTPATPISQADLLHEAENLRLRH